MKKKKSEEEAKMNKGIKMENSQIIKMDLNDIK